MDQSTKIRRALISVSDKSSVVDFGKALAQQDVEIIATGGTEQLLKQAGIPVMSVAEYTGMSEILEGRVKTLHPRIQAGILARRGDPAHQQQMRQLGYPFIDLVCINLYPFEETIKTQNVSLIDILEQIDIGGPTLIRAAAKNFADVTVVTSPKQYDQIVAELTQNEGNITGQTRQKLATQAFAHIAWYDVIIANWFADRWSETEHFPEYLTGAFRQLYNLRYGENPHQKACFYRKTGYQGPTLADCTILSGKGLSYNNITDLDFALQTVLDFTRPCAVIVKHANPCGLACADNLADAYRDALECDPESAYGCIIGLNHIVEIETARRINETHFVECILSPGYTSEAIELLKQKKNRRILACPVMQEATPLRRESRLIRGGLLLQTPDIYTVTEKDLRIVTEKEPTPEQIQSLLFAFQAVKQVKSNAIIIARGEKTVGIGGGLTSRVEAVRLALSKALNRAQGAVLASDAFFPMRDSIDLAARAGIAAIIQPGGSKADPEVIAACNEQKIAMIFTGIRHFRH